MSESVATMLKIVGALAITAIIVAFAFSVVNSQKEVATNSAEQIAQMASALSESEAQQLLGSQKMGSEVLMMISRFEKNSNGIYIKVKNLSGNAEVYVCDESTGEPFTVADEAAKFAEAKKATSDKYINPSAKFQVKADTADPGLIYNDATGALRGIVFTQIP